ncbi:RNA-directed DNA polymerase, eukaryota [Tanacetum coccineum]|uniref:RNA-directed DNA polymerase, eukaryota n=1 Tax=Tanacetum coccineum TaxID=301880 RepID=A0ABQ5AKR3_9ASTR
MVSFDVFVVRAFWGNMLFDFATSFARGRSGGILCVWDKTLFQKKRTYATDHCLCVEGTWLASDSNLLFLSVYSPQELNLKRALWSYISGIISQWHGEVVVMGDFNEVRYASERYGSSFHALNAADFNMFIANSNLIDIPLGGYSFTWSDKHASKMSNLDRFLVSQGIVDLFPNLTGLILHRHISDHRPILLKETRVDYGPTPFRLFHSWFLDNDLCAVVEDSWKNDGVYDNNAMVLLKNKLKSLKQKLKTWSIDKKRSKEYNRKSLQDTIIEIDLRLDKGISLPDDLSNRSNAIRELNSIDQQASMDAAQKAKVTWAIEGDENSKFFHGIVNKKRRHLAIKGILVEGEWIDNPLHVKSEFFNHFANQFSDPDWTRVPFDGQFLNHLDSVQSSDLESDVSNEEIKRAVWDCGSDKSPGPDGFTFEIFKKFWYIVSGDVINVVKEFFHSSIFPNGCNSSFIALIPKVLDAKHLNDFRPISLIGCQYKIIGKILANQLSLVINDIISLEQSAFIKGRQITDGPLILNEIISWCKYRKEQALMFKWRGWIRGCLTSSKASILVNGSPTDEFLFHRGLRQGDPLSPFLFILVMESLHVSFQRLIDRGLFSLILIGKDNLIPISHLFYADDAMFIGKWSYSNVNAIMMMLQWFFLASGLKVNVHKSCIYGVGVRLADIKELADSYGCLANNLSFAYLGVKVGANMNRINSLNDVVQKVKNKLYTWKAKTFSVGGRLTLIKSILGAIPTYYMSLFKAPEGVLSRLERLRRSFFLGADMDDHKISWVSWRQVMAHKKNGGLGVNSMYALNLALFFKWIWHFMSSHSGLWYNVIKEVHGSNSLDNSFRSSSHGSVWIGMLKVIANLKSKGIDLLEYCKLVIGNGNSTQFWHDKWYEDIVLKENFHRLYNLETQKDVLVAHKLHCLDLAASFRRPPRSGIEESQLSEISQLISSVVLSPSCDRWSWTLNGLGVFSVKSAREWIDQHVLPSSLSTSRWSKILPIKVNVFIWRMFLDRLPTRPNLGVDIPCSLCPNCGIGIESRNHLFFGCSMALDLFKMLGRWWNIQVPVFEDPVSWSTWFNNLNLSSLQKIVLEASIFSLWWHIWTYRNATIFSLKKPLKGMIFDNFVSQTYLWVKNMCSKFNVIWVVWLNDPLNAISM